MKVLVCWPPHVPSYFNAGHHLPVFSLAAYLRAAGHEVDALDAGALNHTWKEFADTLYQGNYEAVVLVNDFDVVEGVRRAADYARALAPAAGLVTVGRLSHQNSGFFQSLDLDAVAVGGDYEPAVTEALEWMAEGRPEDPDLAGVAVRTAGGWVAPKRPGTRLPVEEWVLPDVREIPYTHYENLYSNDQNKFCGIPQRRELVVPVARGCPVGCDFCDVPAMQGLSERRMPVARVMDYIRRSFEEHPFEYVAFYAPTFTLRRPWIVELCEAMAAEPREYQWKCATTMHHLDEELIARMGRSGCVRISVGVETFQPEAETGLPRIKRDARRRFDDLVRWCHQAGVELNCFVIVGLPGTTPDGARHTIELINEAGARARPTLYTPYHLMRPDMTERELSGFNRHTFIPGDPAADPRQDPLEFLDVVFGGDGYTTPVTERIPRAEPAPVRP
ncbi:hypothetical protein CIB93_20605 [Streptomyces sp. WZ.A104]|uniref:B12-binding domain-containing radical SAM protein n=1 Tax=Streptomyces sp. WZ.A104 TaxID=2023771 RepID=UPI000BBCE8E2|nr:radical SAM protein [Streptomyces sp. WZ.A104]PCG84218.1 hypothetical protein CIB93_20605 [Streptomyces sp. WZ.A104]